MNIQKSANSQHNSVFFKHMVAHEKAHLLFDLQQSKPKRLLICGDMPLIDPLTTERLQRCWRINDSACNIDLRAEYMHLPFQKEQFNAVVLAHVLETEEDRDALLKEIWRVLVPEGECFIFALNPYSLLNTANYYHRDYQQFRNNHHLLSYRQLRNALSDADFTIKKMESLYYRPLVDNKYLHRSLAFMDILGKLFWPFNGGIIYAVAAKQVIPLTPMRVKHKRKHLVIDSEVANPVTRNYP